MDKEHVIEKPGADGDSTVQANSTNKGKSSHDYADTNPRGFGDGTGHKEHHTQERTRSVELEAGSKSNQQQPPLDNYLEIREAKRTKGEHLNLKDNRDRSEEGSMEPRFDLDNGGEGSRRVVRNKETREGKQPALEKARVRAEVLGQEGEEKNLYGEELGRPNNVDPVLAQEALSIAEMGKPSPAGSMPRIKPNLIEHDISQGTGVGIVKEQDNGEPRIGKGLLAKTLNIENKDQPVNLSCLQEAISAAMKEAMAIQLKDWFQSATGVKRAKSLKEKIDNKEDTIVEETALEESGSRESHCPNKNEKRTPGEKQKLKMNMRWGVTPR